MFMGLQKVKCYYEADDSSILELVVGAEASQFWPASHFQPNTGVVRSIVNLENGT